MLRGRKERPVLFLRLLGVVIRKKKLKGCVRVDGGASSVAGIVGIFHIACAGIVFVVCDWATKGVDNDNFTGAGCAT